MPLFHYTCGACSAIVKKILPYNFEHKVICPKCGGALQRAPSPPTTQVMEHLDNGIMPRAVERLSDAETLAHDRSRTKPRRE